MKNLWPAITFILISTSMFGQQAVIGGKVMDTHKEIISNAEIKLSLHDKTINTIHSNEKGIFVFENLAKGIYTLETTHPSYSESITQVKVTDDSANQFFIHSIKMEDKTTSDNENKNPNIDKSAVIKEGNQETETEPTPKTSWKGKAIPPFSLKDMDGKTWTDKSILEKPTVINFWHSGCGPCIKEMPDLNKWLTEYPDANYLSCTWNTKAVAKKITDRQQFLFHNLVDGEKLFDKLNIKITPTTIVIDKKGIIQLIIIGSSDKGREMIIEKVKELGK